MRSHPVHILSVLVFCTFIAGIAKAAYVGTKYDPKEKHGLEKIVPASSDTNHNIYSKIYTIHGESMVDYVHYQSLEDYTVTDDDGTPHVYTRREKIAKRERTDDTTDLYIPTDPAYASIIGIRDQCGLLKNAKGVLTADGLPINKERSEGDYIITTIHSKAQKEAIHQLEEYRKYYNQYVNENFEYKDANGNVNYITDHTTASIAVVSSDGAILVAAGTNTFETMDYINELDQYSLDSGCLPHELDPQSLITVNLPLDHTDFVGSSFKPVTARVLEQNNDSLDPEYSIYNDSFVDVDSFTYDGKTYGNWDGAHGDRLLSLSLAFKYSSNLYFMRHAINLGLDKYCKELCRLFLLDKELETDIGSVQPLPFNEVRPETITYGQGAKLSPVHLASLYNALLFSGDLYTPFMTCEVRDPELGLIYHQNSNDNKKHLFDVERDENGSNIIVEGLKDTFLSYIENNTIDSVPDDILRSGRFIAKSGTADKVDDHVINRTMCVSILNKEQTDVICTGVIAINTIDADAAPSNYSLVKALIDTMTKLEGVI